MNTKGERKVGKVAIRHFVGNPTYEPVGVRRAFDSRVVGIFRED